MPRAANRARTLREFDDVVTAPVHGFAGVDDYYTRASSKPWLTAIRVPTLLLNARDDPFLPGAATCRAPTHPSCGCIARRRSTIGWAAGRTDRLRRGVSGR